MSTSTYESEKGHQRQNRKCAIRSDSLNFEGIVYEINQGASGIYSPILRRFIGELQKMLIRYNRVFALRFDLHHKGIIKDGYKDDNKWLTRFRKNLGRRIERAYGLSDVGYLWVREHERGKAQHYHYVLLMDGDIIRHPARLNELIDKTWSAINPVNTVFHPKNQYYFVDSEEVERDLIYRVSYMAKARGKGYRPKHVNDFSASSLTGGRGTYCEKGDGNE